VAGVLPIRNLVENLLWTLLDDTQSKRNIDKITMGLLFIQLLDHTDKLSYESHEDRAIMELLGYVEENYRDGTLTEAAARLHYDFFWLSHEIKNRTGRSYTEHVQEKRLSMAAILLQSTTLSVEEIALAVGYENKSYFHRIFKSKYGTSPKKYRSSK
jgi:YesN/AraC family two-component response regulator